MSPRKSGWLEDEMKVGPEPLANGLDTSDSFLAAVQAALKEADAEDFASRDDVDRLARKWSQPLNRLRV